MAVWVMMLLTGSTFAIWKGRKSEALPPALATENLIRVEGGSGCDTGAPMVEFLTELLLVARSRMRSGRDARLKI